MTRQFFLLLLLSPHIYIFFSSLSVPPAYISLEKWEEEAQQTSINFLMCCVGC